MTPRSDSDSKFFKDLENISKFNSKFNKPKFIALNRIDCYQLHRYISMEFDCICEDLTWDNELIFNTEIHTHKDLYENLFKLRFKGVQLGQES